MAQEDVNPFTAPGAKDEVALNSDWKQITLRKGLKLWFVSLCTGMVVQLATTLVGVGFGTTTNGMWYLSYSTIQLVSLLNVFVCIAAGLNLFRAAPPVAARYLAAIVLLFTMITPISIIGLPVLSRMLAVQAVGWVQVNEKIFQTICSISLMVLLRMIAKRFEQRDAYGIAGLVICLELGLIILPIAFVLAGTPMQSTGDLFTIYSLCTVGVLFVKSMVVYLLMSHLRFLAKTAD